MVVRNRLVKERKMLRVTGIIFLLLGTFVAGIVTAKTKPMAVKPVATKLKAVVKPLGAQGPDAGTADLSVPSVAISYPTTWTQGSFTFAAETSCFDHGSKIVMMTGYVRDAGKAIRGSVTLTYDPVGGNVFWKGNVVSNQPSNLASLFAAAATTVRSLVSSGTIIPDAVQ